MARHDRIQLSDDGTMDTVLVCRSCGAEARYNYENCVSDDNTQDSRANKLREQFTKLMPPGTTRNAIEQRVNEQLYAEFVEWAREDFDSDHECGQD